MQTIHVRSEPSGPYTRLTWVCPFTGQRKRVSIGRADQLGKREIRAAITRKEQELNNDPALAAMGRMNLEQWGRRYLETAGLSEATAKDMGHTITLLTERFGAAKTLADITTAEARDFAIWLKDRRWRDRALAEATRNKHVRYAKIIFNRAYAERERTGLTRNPFEGEKSGVPRVNKEWRTVTVEEMARILDRCPNAGWRCMFALCRWAGLRQQEAWRLTWEDVSWDHPYQLTVRVPLDFHGNAKDEDTKKAYRKVPIDAQLYAVLREAFETAEGGRPCEGLPGDGSAISATAAAIARRAGLTYAKPLHTLRKNLETEWARVHPLPMVCQWLGNSPRVAMAHYIEPTLEDVARVSGPELPRSVPQN